VFFKGAKEVTPEVRGKLTKALQQLEGFLHGSSFVAGNEPSLADISILSNVVQVKTAFGGIGNLPNVNAWFERCKTLPGYDENLAGGAVIAGLLDKLSLKIAPLE
jgi:glutathione S-transferase